MFLAIIAAGIIGLSIHKISSQLIFQHEIAEIIHNIKQQRDILLSEVETLRHDITYITHTPPIQGIMRTQNTPEKVDPQYGYTLEEWREQLILLFSEFIQTKPYYYQIRFIGVADLGREIVRVERSNNHILTTAKENLQQKNNRPYFQEALKCKPRQIYLSNINLNREYGRISKPHIPTLRAAIPVYTPKKKVFGIIIINMDLSYLFNRMKKAVLKPNQPLPY